MNKFVIWLGAALILITLNCAIWEREQLLKTGEVVYLKLAPVDPRSLMQGDYMVLRYDIAREVKAEDLASISGRLIIQLAADQVAHFSRHDDGLELAKDERYLAYKHRRGAQFGIESFFFQEGTAEQYANATHAKIKLSPDGKAILIDLVNLTRDSDEV